MKITHDLYKELDEVMKKYTDFINQDISKDFELEIYGPEYHFQKRSFTFKLEFKVK